MQMQSIYYNRLLNRYVCVCTKWLPVIYALPVDGNFIQYEQKQSDVHSLNWKILPILI